MQDAHEIHEPLAVRGRRISQNTYEIELSVYRAVVRECRLDAHGDWQAEFDLRAPHGRIYWARICLTSASKRKEIAREFYRRTGDRQYDIELALEYAFRWVVEQARTIPAWDYDADADVPRQRYILYPLVPDNAVSVLAGDGGTGKGYIALMIACAVATGTPIAGFHVAPDPRAVLYLDYESTQEDFTTRVHRIVRGHNLPRGIRLRYLRADTPYLLLHNQVRAHRNALDAALVIVDSLAPAIGPLTEGASASIDTMRALRELGCAVLCIAHIAKHQLGDKNPTPYGSVFIRNLARNVWIQAREAESERGITVSLRHAKSNLCAPHRTILVRMQFDADAVRYEQVREEERVYYSEQLTLNERILASLTEPKTARQIAEQLGEREAKVIAHLNQLARDGRVAILEGTGRRGSPRVFVKIDLTEDPFAD